MDDVQAVYELAAACSLDEHGQIDFTLDEIRSYWTNAVADLVSDVWVIFTPEGHLVAEADASRKAPDALWLYATVHPDHAGRGLGTYLMAQGEQRMREWAEQAPQGMRVMARQEISTGAARARALLEHHGYLPVRRSWRMLIEMSEPPAQPEWPAGIAVRAFIPGQDERPIYEAMEEAFADHWGHAPHTFEEYAQWNFQGERYDPSLYVLAVDGEAIAGCALCRRRPDMGWVGGLGVRQAYRRRGVGLALLQQAFGEFYRRGERAVGLGVDAQNPTGAVQLYERAGMRPIREWVEYAKELRPGGKGGEDTDAQ
jgi:mycothiol synthase